MTAPVKRQPWATIDARDVGDVGPTAPAGRLFKFTEEKERALVDAMRDIDEMRASADALYAGHTWTRSDFIQLFFLDCATDQLQYLVDREAER